MRFRTDFLPRVANMNNPPPEFVAAARNAGYVFKFSLYGREVYPAPGGGNRACRRLMAPRTQPDGTLEPGWVFGLPQEIINRCLSLIWGEHDQLKQPAS